MSVEHSSETRLTVSGFSQNQSLRELVAAHRAYRRAGPDKNEAHTPVRVAIVANFSTQFLSTAIELSLAARDFAPEIYEAGYNQFEIELTDPDGGLSNYSPDVVVIVLTSQLLCLRQVASDPALFAANLAQTVNAAAQRLPARFVLTLPELLEEEIEQTSWAREWRHTLVASLRHHLEPSICTIDLDPLIVEVGASAWFSPRFFATSKLPFAPDHSALVGDYLARFVAGAVRRPVRLVIVDLDDTIWGGTVGEIGWRNVDLDAEGAGYGFLRMQRFLAGLHAAGVLLAICSKNEPENTLDVFRKRPEMILKEDQFAAIRINWEPKSTNISSILEELNLTEPGCVFLDDNPLERNEVSHQMSEIWVPALPDDPNERVAFLARSGRFTLPVTTADDRNRQAMYSAEHKRRQAQKGNRSLADYYKSLDLVLEPMRPDNGNQQRILDLIRKTNQFNATTRRHNLQQLQALTDKTENEVWAYSLADRYATYGLISVLIAVRREEAFVIDTWLMSCRALGRTVENAVFAHLWKLANARGIERIIADYIPTEKNKRIAGLFPELGFTQIEAKGGMARFEFQIGDKEPENPFVSILG